jgi:membrane-bound serine protease (ClpP class)
VTPGNLILLLTLVGFLLLAGEVFVPGMVLGLLGLLSLASAVVLGYGAFGPVQGSLIFAGIAAVTMIGFVVWMFTFPHTAIGRRIMLRKALDTGEGEKPKPELLGLEGEAQTILRPAGTARIAGRKVDVVAEGSFIPAGAKIVVVAQEGVRVVVRNAA